MAYKSGAKMRMQWRSQQDIQNVDLLRINVNGLTICVIQKVLAFTFALLHTTIKDTYLYKFAYRDAKQTI